MHLLDWMSKLEAAKKKKAIGQPDKEPTPKFFPKVLTLSGNFHGTLGTDKAKQQPLLLQSSIKYLSIPTPTLVAVIGSQSSWTFHCQKSLFL